MDPVARRRCGICVVVLAVWLAGGSAALASAWSIQPSPYPLRATDSSLLGVSCASPTACTAVGVSRTSLGTHGLVERWNGERWLIERAATPLGGGSRISLEGVSCVSPVACVAVGSYGQGPLVERWDGRGWSIQSLPSQAAGGSLSAVSCASPIVCVAVGSYTSAGVEQAPLVERWNGRRWYTQPTPESFGPGSYADLVGVSCASSTECTAVGNFNCGAGCFGPGGSLAEHWNGSTWSIQPTPEPRGASAELNAVSCASKSSCTAVGVSRTSLGTRGLVERWNGASWSVQRSVAYSPSLASVSCASPSACTAGGGWAILRWNGRRWSIRPLGVKTGSLTAVSCSRLTVCTVVGGYKSARAHRPLAERSNRTRWSVQRPPDPTGPAQGSLQGVSCASPTACAAVGSYVSSEGRVTFAERWNGSSWSIQPTPSPAGTEGINLTAVSCASSNACTAVGYNGAPVAERWDGTRWSVQQIPNPGWRGGLNDVSCVSPTACVTVGSYLTGPNTTDKRLTLVERWDGRSWAIQATPNIPLALESGGLTGVSCTSPAACTAVGGPGYSQLPLLERWDGASWSIESTPDHVGPNQIGVGFTKVSCASSAACTAVGSNGGTLAESWDGTVWSTMPTPTLVGGGYLSSVSCLPADICTTVGSVTPARAQLTLAERWEGSGWSIQPTPNPPAATQTNLAGVSCPSTTACIAVGSYTDTSGATEPLVERWNSTG